MTAPHVQPEVWLRGAVEGYPGRAAAGRPRADAGARGRRGDRSPRSASTRSGPRPGGAASIGFHARHLAGALDRLYTYARGLALSETQIAYMKAEGVPGDPAGRRRRARRPGRSGITRRSASCAARRCRSWPRPRAVGRKQLPTTVLGLLFHGAEHCTRHAGQIDHDGEDRPPRLTARAPRPCRSSGPPKVYPVIVIGSGASGGMAAWNLTRKGVDVLPARRRHEVRSRQVLDARPPVGSARAPRARRAAAAVLPRHEGAALHDARRQALRSRRGCGATAARPTSGAASACASSDLDFKGRRRTAGRSPGRSPTPTSRPTTTRSSS